MFRRRRVVRLVRGLDRVLARAGANVGPFGLRGIGGDVGAAGRASLRVGEREAVVSVACSNQESLAGAHPAWHYAGSTFALAGGAAKEVKLQDVCAPAAACTKRLAAVLLTLPDGPSTYDDATLTKYLAKPTFVLGETALRLLVDEDLSGYAAHGLSCDLPYGELGALLRLQPGAATK